MSRGVTVTVGITAVDVFETLWSLGAVGCFCCLFVLIAAMQTDCRNPPPTHVLVGTHTGLGGSFLFFGSASEGAQGFCSFARATFFRLLRCHRIDHPAWHPCLLMFDVFMVRSNLKLQSINGS